MRQRTFLPANGWLENFFLLLKFTCPKHRKVGSAHKQLRIPPEALGGQKWAKQTRKPNNEAENLFACQGLVGELFSVDQIHMSKSQKDIKSAHKQLCRPPGALGGHKKGKTA